MTAFLQRIAFALGLQKREEPESFDYDGWMAGTYVVLPTPIYDALVADAEKGRTRSGTQPDYLADFGPNVPVEDLGGKPVYFENNQPVYPGREKAP